MSNGNNRGRGEFHSDLPSDVEQDCQPVPATQSNFLSSIHRNLYHSYSDRHPLVTGGSSMNTSHVSVFRKNDDIVPELSSIYDDYKLEEKRYQTFHDWPVTLPVNKHDLARNGFIYMHVKDRTQCVFCRGVLSNWELGDVVEEEHKKHCPECPFAFGYECGNIPIQRQTSTVIVSRQNGNPQPQFYLPPSSSNSEQQTYNTTVKVPVQSQFSQRPYGEVAGLHYASNRPDSHSSLPALPSDVSGGQHTRTDITTNEPKYKDWGDEYKRVRSYKGWPTQMSQVPLELAKAGLMYMGYGDRCKCFWCGGELYDWEPQDQPWEEHAKWFPHCGYVRAMKGDSYITHIRNVQNGTETPSNNNMSTPHILSVLSEGYSQAQVEEAFNRFGRERLVDARSIKEAIEQTRQERQTILSGSAGTQETGSPVQMQYEDMEMEEAEPSNQEQQSETKKENKPKDIPSSSSLTPRSSNASPSDVETVLKENEKLKDQKLCKICMDNELCMTFLPCGHLATCEDCANSVRECPICRKPITQKLKVFWS